MEFIAITPGSFLMGSNDPQAVWDEKPPHRVTITQPFLISRQLVSIDEIRRFDANLKLNEKFAPIAAGISWTDAHRYCQWLTSKTGRAYRLPTEAEWERGARGDFEQQDFPWGNEPPQSFPNYSARWQTGPEPVARYAPNAFGLYDVCDNVHEWCSDWYDPNYYAASPERNPRGPDQSPTNPQRKSSRGGSWRHHIKVSRCSARSSIPRGFHYADYGFRVASSV